MPMTDSYQASHCLQYPPRPRGRTRFTGMPHPRSTWNVHWPVFRSALRHKKGPFVHKHIHFTFERHEDGSISISRSSDEAAMNFLLKHESLHRMMANRTTPRVIIFDRSGSMSNFSDRGGTDIDSATIDAIRASFGAAK